MELTKLRRHSWIRKDRPLIQEVIDKFPCLSSSRWMRREFKGVISFDDNVNSLMDSWPEWYRKLIKLSKLESSSRPLIRKILAKLDENSGDNNVYDAYCLDLLYRLLFPHGIGKMLFLSNILRHVMLTWRQKQVKYNKLLLIY